MKEVIERYEGFKKMKMAPAYKKRLEIKAK
jgi:hypothetical protein